MKNVSLGTSKQNYIDPRIIDIDTFKQNIEQNKNMNENYKKR